MLGENFAVTFEHDLIACETAAKQIHITLSAYKKMFMLTVSVFAIESAAFLRKGKVFKCSHIWLFCFIPTEVDALDITVW